MSVTKKQIEALLNDPNVPQDKKDALNAAIMLNGSPMSYGGEWNTQGTQWYQSAPDSASWDNSAIQNAYNDAQSAGQVNSYNQDQTTTAVNNGKTALNGVQAPALGSSGTAQKSDDVLKPGESGLQVFQLFLQAWNGRPADCLGQTAKLNYDTDITKRYQEQYGIDFQKFLTDGDNLGKANSTAAQTHTDVGNTLNSLYKDWSGDASSKSSDAYNKDIDPKITELTDALSGASSLIGSTVQAVFGECKAKAQDVLNLYRTEVGGATPYMANLVVKMAASDGSDSDDDSLRSQIGAISEWVDQKTGSNITSRVNDDSCSLNSDNIQYCIQQCKKWIQDSFNKDFWGDDGAPGLKLQFDKICDNAKTAVDGSWKNLTDTMKKYQNDFPAAAAAPTTPSSSTGTGSGTGTGGGGGNPKVSIPTGGSSPSSTGSSTPSVTMPSSATPSTSSSGVTSPSSTVPSGTTTPSSAQQPETMTVQNGTGTISMTSPNSQGQVQLSVADGSGKPKTYDIDFGNGSTSGSGSGLTGLSGTGLSGTGTGTGTGLGTGAGTGVLSGSGSGVGIGSGSGSGSVQHITPGPDGKAVIHDGKTTITVTEPKDHPGEVQVTVDDGSGKPTTYTLEGGATGTSAASGLTGTPVDTTTGVDTGTTGTSGTQGVPAQPVGTTAQPVTAQPVDTTAQPVDTTATSGTGQQLDYSGAVPGSDPTAASGTSYQDPAGGYQDPTAAAAAASTTQPAAFNLGQGGDLGGSVGGTPGGGAGLGNISLPAGHDAVGGAVGHAGGQAVWDSGSGQAGGGHAQLAGTDVTPAGDPGHAGLGSTTDQQGASGMSGGMPMMGGMGGGGGQGGDGERGPSQWRTQGQLFDDSSGGVGRISGVLTPDELDNNS
jgi:hypothetical protein